MILRKEIRALLHDLLHDALALIILLPRLEEAPLVLRHPGMELFTPRQRRPVVSQPRRDRLPHRHAWKMQIFALSCGDSSCHPLPRLTAAAASSARFCAYIFLPA